MENILTKLGECAARINDAVWGIPLILFIIGVGVLYTFGLKGIQFRKLWHGCKLLFCSAQNERGEKVSTFGALSTALAAMIGTGNIVGVATAVVSGGPGAIFWMLMASLAGMAVSYAEGLLAVKFKYRDRDGNALGGAFMYIERGMGRKFIPLAKLFAFFCAAAAILGIGTFTQVNAISETMMDLLDTHGKYKLILAGTEIHIVRLICAAVVTLLAGCTVFGGISRISSVSEKIVPIMGGMYILATLTVLFTCAEQVPNAIKSVMVNAFTGRAAFGGACGTAVAKAIRMGVARGVFSNEAGLGSASIAAAAAPVKQPARQGFVSMVGTFIDTTLMCTLTGLAIVASGAINSGIDSISLTNRAYSIGFPFAPWFGRGIVSAALALFAFASIIGWNYYGEQCTEYLAGKRAVPVYRIVYLAAVFTGCFVEMKTVWDIADILNGCMALPNLIALLILYPVVKRETEKYLKTNSKI